MALKHKNSGTSGFAESECLELKRSTSELKEAVISIAAMLNKHQKGELIFGINNAGETMGQQVSESTLRAVSKAIADHIEPKIYPVIKKNAVKGKDCIKVSFSGNEVPYLAYGRGYIRVADENRLLSGKELENLYLAKKRESWDSQVSSRKLRDVNITLIRKYIVRANIANRINFKYSNPKSVLKKLSLIKGNRLLRAGEILFCDTNSLEVQAAVFAGTDKSTFIDIKQLKGNLFSLLERSEAYIKEHIDWRAVLNERTRQEIPEIPVRAIIEALVNSLCHRDYTAPESNKIAIYKDRIEVWNPGNFPEGHTPLEYVRKDEESILRNPLIANILYLSKDIEKWGSGLRRIYEECRNNSVRVEFRPMKYGYKVVFYRSMEKVPEKVTVKVPEKVTANQRRIINSISRNNTITARELSRKIHISQRRIKSNLAKLKRMGIIARVGPDKGGYWQIIKD